MRRCCSVRTRAYFTVGVDPIKIPPTSSTAIDKPIAIIASSSMINIDLPHNIDVTMGPGSGSAGRRKAAITGDLKPNNLTQDKFIDCFHRSMQSVMC